MGRLKDYLNKTERDNFIMFGYITDFIYDFLTDWKQRGNLTKEEETNLKYTKTYSEKFYKGVLDRLNEKEVSQIMRNLKGYTCILVDNYAKDRMKKEAAEIDSKVIVGRNEFEDFCSEIMAVRCKGCTQHFSKCKDLYDMFHNNSVPESGYDLPNCKYAYVKKGR